MADDLKDLRLIAAAPALLALVRRAQNLIDTDPWSSQIEIRYAKSWTADATAVLLRVDEGAEEPSREVKSGRQA